MYDAASNLTSKTDRNNHSILYVYDALNRLTHKGYPDSTGVDYVYDLAGKIKQVTDPTGTYGMAYDNMGRLIGTSTQYSFITGTPTFSNTYAYDAASNRTSLTLPDNSTDTYQYDTLNRLTKITDSLSGQFTFGYDGLSRRTSLGRPNSVATSYSYDSLSRLLNVLHKNGATTLDGATYTYDNAGNRTSKANQLNSVSEQYTYDPLYQLTQVTQGSTTTESYSYDVVGNRLSSLGVSSYSYNSSNELTSNSAVTFTYDNNGNTLAKTDSSGIRNYTWDFENRLASVVLPGTGGTVTFKYDPFGRRIQKISPSSTTNYLYDADNAIEELDSGGNELARYVQGRFIDEPLGELRSGTKAWYEQDGLGSVTSLSDPTGTLSTTATYDAFGNITASTGSLANPFQYTGRDYDSETGLRYYRTRYYDPTTGRFISADPIGFQGGVNVYRYVRNNPTNEIDPLGLCPPNKCRLTVNCGPKPATHGVSHCTVTVQNGDTYTAYDGEPADDHVFWGTLIVVKNKLKGRGAHNFIDEQVPCDCAQKEADAINAAHLVYSAFIQNSNTAAAMITQACGIPTPFRSTDIWGWGPADPITGPWGTSTAKPMNQGPMH